MSILNYFFLRNENYTYYVFVKVNEAEINTVHEPHEIRDY